MWQPIFKTVYLCAAGTPPDLNFVQAIDRTAAHLVAVDGGAEFLARHNILPDCIMGDLDSVAVGIFPQVPRNHLSCQYQSDLEKSLRYCLLHGMTVCILLGADGGKHLDHAAANMDLITLYADQCRMQMRAAHAIIDGLVAGQYDFPIQPGQRVGVLPSSPDAVVTLTGVHYPLSHAALPLGTLGVGNHAASDHLSITVHAGRVRLFREY